MTVGMSSLLEVKLYIIIIMAMLLNVLEVVVGVVSADKRPLLDLLKRPQNTTILCFLKPVTFCYYLNVVRLLIGESANIALSSAWRPFQHFESSTFIGLISYVEAHNHFPFSLQWKNWWFLGYFISMVSSQYFHVQ